jgi:hypothetical protein
LSRLLLPLDESDQGTREHKLGGEPRKRLQNHGVIVGMPNESVEQLGPLAESGVQQVMLQWLEVDDIDGLEAFARSVPPQW